MATALMMYPGSKRAMVGFLLPEFPQEIEGCWIEPFVGSASVFLAARPELALLSDLDNDIVDFLCGVRDDPDAMWEIYSKILWTRRSFEEWMKRRPRDLGVAEKAARLLFLNRACFKSVWRHRPDGRLLASWGYRPEADRWHVSKANVEAVSVLLQGVRIVSCDFEDSISIAHEGDFVFLDPPYSPGDRALRGPMYGPLQWRFGDQERLAKVLRDATDRRVLWAMTNSSHKDILSLYRGHEVFPFPWGTSHSFGARVRRRGSGSAEVLICNYRKPVFGEPEILTAELNGK